MAEERRVVTILFADVAGSTALGDALDPEDVRSISLFDRAGAVPYAARVHCERALITNDHGEMEAGMAVLARLGDTEQLARFERLAVG